MATLEGSEMTPDHHQDVQPAKEGTVFSDPYRSHMYDDLEVDTEWRHGGPPGYEAVNALFEQGRTRVWPKGSLEEIVQNLVKSWEMELSHKMRASDFKTIDPQRFTLSANGGEKLTAQETLKVGSYNALLATALPGEHEDYKATQETFDSSHDVFRTTFPGGFAWEVLEVYSGPPTVAFKWRHWGQMEGAFKGHAPTRDVAVSIGTCVAKVDENLKIVELEVYYDPTQFLGHLTKLPKSQEYGEYKQGIEGCPFSSLT
ncbi:hypothetical protein O6H91_21G068800 [Diphasiastrum complanatum]|uniref:Uncharacterized protein n=1 Tax=Diphasiastrum complanatum TaxID=34168 RepID=A0ACC2ALJ8_DIPCM|nr:hypothetical protein O6H91_Y192100 [Diphasiastrum complanatum]KAJ7518438.1 hypothetical protein O6H91_21G068800 [Diphasiastrum complanatum]